MSEPAPILWTHEDAVARRCRFIDVGRPRLEEAPPPEPDVPTAPPSDIADLPEVVDLPAKVLKRDLMRAYQRLGGVEWLVGLPRPEFVKLMLRLLPQEGTVQHEGEVTLKMVLRPSPLDDAAPEYAAPTQPIVIDAATGRVLAGPNPGPTEGL